MRLHLEIFLKRPFLLLLFRPSHRPARPAQPDVAGPPSRFSDFQVLQHFASQNAQDDKGWCEQYLLIYLSGRILNDAGPLHEDTMAR